MDNYDVELYLEQIEYDQLLQPDTIRLVDEQDEEEYPGLRKP